MRTLLTGATGFVGSHVLDRLAQEGASVRILIRAVSSTRWIAPHLGSVEVVQGSLDDPRSLDRAVAGDVDCVIHCAGAIKALRPEELDRVNRDGTRRLVEAANRRGGRIRRFLYLSSLAAGRPGTPENPADETAPPAPVSCYGRSKLAGEEEVKARWRGEWTILRPAAVYGPRDREFLPVFRAARRGFCPAVGDPRRALSLVWVEDLARCVAVAAESPEAAGETINVASPEIVRFGQIPRAAARALGRQCVVPLRTPALCFRAICRVAALWARLRGKPTVLAHGKDREVLAPGWVANTTRLRRLFGEGICATKLADGFRRTARWYAEAGWI
ncbi:MAG: NAD-dependent epimerase/dehydratase family protein [Verrucomicrobia bacterium]|nr:NAD-dependent epimerase/dehydratase family protein [Verrucomicrobiota bacterium]